MSTVSELFGSLVFNDTVMKERLPKETYRAMQNAIRDGRHLADFWRLPHDFSTVQLVPITVTLKEAAPKGLNMGNYKLYHVEDGANNAMTLVASEADFNDHNQFTYDP
ncbi:MAG: hypothetical protein IJB22_01995, partial [Clostridia bacterium]|nr:hypothetical protein [Clostridia bacterium]